jgi:hypothetical protein
MRNNRIVRLMWVEGETNILDIFNKRLHSQWWW